MLYEKMVSWLEVDVMKPDVTVYLQAGTDTLMDRISRRGRPYEREIDREYLHKLNEAYNHFFFHYNATPLLVVETSQFDLTWGSAALDDLVKQLKGMGRGTRYYVPRTL